MYRCRLFRIDQPFTQVETRTLEAGRLSIGRDPEADWTLADPTGTLSRIHCTLAVNQGRLLLTDNSTNGTYLESGERAAKNVPIELKGRQTIRLGQLNILIEDTGFDEHQSGKPSPTLYPASTPTPTDWADGAAPSRAPHRDASLLEAFCEGARIDASELSSEDPEDLMRRLGALYQQTIIGLATLMSDRARFKADHDLEGTSIGAERNNPFKWTPTRKLAQDLLRTRHLGFLSDVEAVRASFQDLSAHIKALTEGANAAIARSIETFEPAAIEEEAKSQATVLRRKSAVCWDVYNRRYASLTQEGTGPSPVTQAFADAYDEAVHRPASED